MNERQNFCRVYRIKGHDIVECFEVFKMAKMLCTQNPPCIEKRLNKKGCAISQGMKIIEGIHS